MQDSGFRRGEDSGCRIEDSGCRIEDSGFRRSDSGARSRVQELGSMPFQSHEYRRVATATKNFPSSALHPVTLTPLDSWNPES